MNSTIKALDTRLYQQRHPCPVFIIDEDFLPGIATQHYMINTTGEVDPWFSRHDGMLTPDTCKSRLTPLPVLKEELSVFS